MNADNKDDESGFAKKVGECISVGCLLASLGFFHASWIALAITILGSAISYLDTGKWSWIDNRWLIDTIPGLGDWLASEPSKLIGAHDISVWYFAYMPISLLGLIISVVMILVVTASLE